MLHLTLLTSASVSSGEVLPALGLLGHDVTVLPPEPAALIHNPHTDVLLVDARTDLAEARSLCRVLVATGLTIPLIVVVGEGGLTVVTAQWGASDLLLFHASPAEVEARLRLAVERHRLVADPDESAEISSGDLVIDPNAYTVKVHGDPIDLTYKEFELLKYLAQHPGRVFTRAQLLQEVWGYDYYGGTRTVDVHVRRLRAKLGPEHEQVIGTVRNVGYRFDPLSLRRPTTPDPRQTIAPSADLPSSDARMALAPDEGTA